MSTIYLQDDFPANEHVSLPLTTLREFSMMQLMNNITDKTGWEEKVRWYYINLIVFVFSFYSSLRSVAPKMVFIYIMMILISFFAISDHISTEIPSLVTGDEFSRIFPLLSPFHF